MAVLINKIFIFFFFLSIFKNNYNIDVISIMHNYKNINLFFCTFFNLIKLNDIGNMFFFNNKNGFNFFLQNTLSFFHPIFLYFFIVNFLKFFFFKKKFIKLKKKNFGFLKIFLLFFSLLLSSFWSSQELFWNGYWNWDIVEISLLNIFIVNIYFLHLKRTNKNLFYYCFVNFIFFLFFFLTNKTNFFLSQHSFSTSFLFKLYFIYFTILFFFFFKIFFLIFFKNSFLIKTFFFLNLFVVFVMFLLKIFNVKWDYNFFIILFYNLFFLKLVFNSFNVLSVINCNFIFFNFFFWKKLKLYISHSFFICIFVKCFFFHFCFQKEYIYINVFNIFNINFFNFYCISQILNYNSLYEVIINFSIYTNFLNNFFFFKIFNFITTYAIYLYLNKIKLQKKLKLFKKRKKLNITFNLDNNICIKEKIYFYYKYIYSRFAMFLELKFYRFFFLKLRRLSKRKKFKSFVLISCNHMFSKKSKNSRMGKGKGKYVRFVFRTKILKPIFIFKKMSKYRVLSFVNLLNKKSENKFFCNISC